MNDIELNLQDSHKNSEITIIKEDKTESSALFENSDKELSNTWRSFGKTKVYFYNNNLEPYITIGPHYCFSICISVFTCVMFIIFYGLLHDKLGFFQQMIGLLISIILISSYMYTVLANPGIPSLDNYKLIRNKQIEIKKCRECRNYIRMDRKTSHCYDCGVCVEGFDHHCPWVSKCIGKKTIISFYIFICSVMLMMCYLITMVALYSVKPVSH